ncbi:MAG: hypothetical protein KR126chlam2_00286 [Chlamydiae bacterium]|nr:hypothetical protein [Chlamydiota bacterium]
MSAHLNATKLGLAGGILSGLSLFIITWISMFTGYGMFWLAQWMDLYPGFDFSIVGAFIGLAYGFVVGFVGFFVFAWIYNFLKP